MGALKEGTALILCTSYKAMLLSLSSLASSHLPINLQRQLQRAKAEKQQAQVARQMKQWQLRRSASRKTMMGPRKGAGIGMGATRAECREEHADRWGVGCKLQQVLTPTPSTDLPHLINVLNRPPVSSPPAPHCKQQQQQHHHHQGYVTDAFLSLSACRHSRVGG